MDLDQTTRSRAAREWARLAGSMALVLVAFSPSAQATTSFTNGTFAQSCTDGAGNGPQVTCTNGNGQLGYNTNVSGWVNTSVGYTFLFNSVTSANTGVTGNAGTLGLWSPGTGFSGANNVANGFVAPPAGGPNFIAADGAYNSQPIYQTITGLVNGATYQVGFYWAASQQYNFNGITTEQWQVSLGSQTLNTGVVTNPSNGFTGWMYQTFNFKATGTSEALSFLSIGTPISPSEPPFALLADVSFSQVTTPEPGTWSMMLGGLGLFGLSIIRSKRRARRKN
jgi:PEP-CTERM motif